MSIKRKLRGIIRIRFKLVNETQLLIRSQMKASAYKIGGYDEMPMSMEITYRLDNREESIEVPYIPGSSLKGRMRSLLELSLGKELTSMDQNGKIWMHQRTENIGKDVIYDILNRCEIDEVFGSPAISKDKLSRIAKKEKVSNKEVDDAFNKLAPTRLLVDNLYPSPEYVRSLYNLKRGSLTLLDFIVEKSENRIDRITSTADPRTFGAVKPGVEFDGMMRLLVFDIDLDKMGDGRTYLHRNLKLVANGMKLVEETYLGSSGSRGYGRVKFKDIRIELSTTVEKDKKIMTLSSVDEFLDKVYDIADKLLEELGGGR